ncbi:MAG: DNA alkylation repair protein [Candidatus Coatesbacteria bacterium]|nr:DNA alkylation repair protein [Candidatus Coatesbacteria bacterium]
MACKDKLEEPYILRSSIIKSISQEHFKHVKGRGKENIVMVCNELLSSNKNAEKFIAFDWVYRIRKTLSMEDFATFENWIEKHIDNWALCDVLCTKALGCFIFAFPEFLKDLKRWASSDNRWFRRASAVTLIYSLRKKRYFKESLEIAEILLQDKEDMVQKGYGWMLKEACKHHEDEVYSFVLARKKIMPRTALRYAIEKMPAQRKKQVMKRD